ncbi:AraC family transcriptional regulator [Ectothiorhodospira lacustris]|uniref:AraC family transcriptional regulator n=1 Tax=Ectothiorhodospira lacustris TaxID=2899127 RepID=UPI001EE78539|nr:AraC family transcriptional regulator [Ectothiorhodospira lacustris]MCG5511138.1 AraC family transcriptional regulator [Ectothiorhodospira lacustris]MCG5522802.1 AraC family transcriptional regulator [Ectothiorhodospira lacustris]
MNAGAVRQRAWYEREARFIPAHHQPAGLIDLALMRGIESHRLLRGTGLFYQDILGGRQFISAEQFLRLIDNVRQLRGGDDCSFLFGQQLLPGHYGHASHALRHAQDLQQALDRLVLLRRRLSPLLTPRVRVDDRYVYLHWFDSCGAGAREVFLMEACMTAVTAMCRWLSGGPLPWEYQLRHSQPDYIEQYWVHLSEAVRFGCPQNVMRLPCEYLFKPWPHASLTVGQVAEQTGLDELAAADEMAPSLLEALFDYIHKHVRQPLGLERLAEAQGMSVATLKRKLKHHDTHFLQQLDQVRTYVALDLYLSKGFTSDEVATYLNFNDKANFRRSFKRWTGLLPSEVPGRLA